MTPEEKEKIDYEIKAKYRALNDEITGWALAFFIAVMFSSLVFAAINAIID